jgi:hypothetical protein
VGGLLDIGPVLVGAFDLNCRVVPHFTHDSNPTSQ